MKKSEICSRCGKIKANLPALCRRDNKTKICNECGTEQAMNDYFKKD